MNQLQTQTPHPHPIPNDSPEALQAQLLQVLSQNRSYTEEAQQVLHSINEKVEQYILNESNDQFVNDYFYWYEELVQERLTYGKFRASFLKVEQSQNKDQSSLQQDQVQNNQNQAVQGTKSQKSQFLAPNDSQMTQANYEEFLRREADMRSQIQRLTEELQNLIAEFAKAQKTISALEGEKTGLITQIQELKSQLSSPVRLGHSNIGFPNQPQIDSSVTLTNQQLQQQLQSLRAENQKLKNAQNEMQQRSQFISPRKVSDSQYDELMEKYNKQDTEYQALKLKYQALQESVSRKSALDQSIGPQMKVLQNSRAPEREKRPDPIPDDVSMKDYLYAEFQSDEECQNLQTPSMERIDENLVYYIYPYTSPEEYYLANAKQRPLKGRQIDPTIHQFDQLSEKNKRYLKFAFFRRKCTLFASKKIVINQITDLVYNNSETERFLATYLNIRNTDLKEKQVQLKVSKSPNVSTNNQLNSITLISEQSVTYQMVRKACLENCAWNEIAILINIATEKRFFLPNPLFYCIQFEKVKQQSFKASFQSMSVAQTPRGRAQSRQVMARQLLSRCTLLNDYCISDIENKLCDAKYGCQFSMLKHTFLLKVILTPQNDFLLFGAFRHDQYECMELVLKSLYFAFT